MFVFKAALVRLEEEIANLKEKARSAESDRDAFKEMAARDRRDLESFKKDMDYQERCASLKQREADLRQEEALNNLRKEMQKALVESDLKRVAAEARLAAYKEMDPKTERTAQAKLLEKAVAGLCDRKPADIHIETAK